MRDIFCEKACDLWNLSGNEIKDKIAAYNGDSSESEKNSWSKSLPKLLEVIRKAGLGNVYVAAEYEIPAGGRIDVTLLGKDSEGKNVGLIVELKQWSIGGIEYIDRYGFPAIKVNANPAYISRHPVAQTKEYVEALTNNLRSVLDGTISISACQYLHDYDSTEKSFFTQGLFSDVDVSRMFLMGEEDLFADFLKGIFAAVGNTDDAKKAFLEGEYVTTEMDMEIINTITEDPENIPLWHDQQRILDDIKILLQRQAEGTLTGKYMIIISGAAGTGKTIIGFRILAEYWNLHKGEGTFKCAYTMPRNRTIKQVLEGLSEDGCGIKPMFLESPDNNSQDLLVIDEAHRITNFWKAGRNINASSITVVLQDDKQRVLGNEIGTLEQYKKFAKSNGMIVAAYSLNYQKRSGVGSYLDRVDRLLYDEKYPVDYGLGISVDVFERLEDLEHRIGDWYASDKSVKYYAPYCWEWKSRNLGHYNDMDIKIPNIHPVFQKQWNPWDYQYEWYLDSIDKVGCIYTAQGLGYNYVGLIWWKDLVWRTDHWETNLGLITPYDSQLKKTTSDKAKNYDYILLNIYRVLLTRAKKGIAIWFEDQETREHFKDIVLK